MKSYFKFMLTAGIIFGFFFAMGAGITNYVQTAGDDTTQEEPADDKQERADGERTNILILGVDKRPGEDRSRSDTMMLASIDPKLDKVAIISIPRDTKVAVKGSPLDKICTANFVGGPEYAAKTVEDFMGVKVDYYIEMDFNGFKDIIDVLGGVTINVPQVMRKKSEDIDLKPGVQKLNGRQALGFVRFRDYVNGDIERTVQQQEFIKALASEVLKAKTIPKLPGLIKQANKYVDTNMTVGDMLKMATWAPGFNSDSVITQTLPGYFYDKYENGIMTQSYWIADQSQFPSMIDNMFAGKTVAVINESPLPPPQVKKDPEEENNPDQKTGEEAKNPDDANRQRNNLPSPGHGGELDIPVNHNRPGQTGPEGYI